MGLIPDDDVKLRKELSDPNVDGTLPSWTTSSSGTNGSVAAQDASNQGGYWELIGAGDNGKVNTSMAFDLGEYDVLEVTTEFSMVRTDGYIEIGFESASTGDSAVFNGGLNYNIVVDNGSVSTGTLFQMQDGNRQSVALQINTVTGEVVGYLSGTKLTTVDQLPVTSDNYLGRWAAVGDLTLNVHSASIRCYDLLTA